MIWRLIDCENVIIFDNLAKNLATPRMNHYLFIVINEFQIDSPTITAEAA
jgi:hypothetical protein